MADNTNTALLKLCRQMHQSLRYESDALKTIAEAKSVMFSGAKISSCMRQLSHHVEKIAESFSDIDGMDIGLLTSRVIAQYNVRYGVFLEQSEDLRENFNYADATLAELWLILAVRFKLYGDKTAGIKINENGLDIVVKRLMDVHYEELKDRHELLNGWTTIFNKDDEHTSIAFVLKKYNEIIRNQAKNLKSLLIDYCVHDIRNFPNVMLHTTFIQRFGCVVKSKGYSIPKEIKDMVELLLKGSNLKPEKTDDIFYAVDTARIYFRSEIFSYLEAECVKSLRMNSAASKIQARWRCISLVLTDKLTAVKKIQRFVRYVQNGKHLSTGLSKVVDEVRLEKRMDEFIKNTKNSNIDERATGILIEGPELIRMREELFQLRAQNSSFKEQVSDLQHNINKIPINSSNRESNSIVDDARTIELQHINTKIKNSLRNIKSENVFLKKNLEALIGTLKLSAEKASNQKLELTMRHEKDMAKLREELDCLKIVNRAWH